MKKLILQHWSGPLQEINRLSTESIKNYSNTVGSDYQFLEGNVFREDLCSFYQKLIVLDEQFDDYDVIVMMDTDMFARKGTTESIFDQTGVGVCDQINLQTFNNYLRRFPKLISKSNPFWGGSIYRLDRELRKILRDQLPKAESTFHLFDRRDLGADETMMHHLAVLADLPNKKEYYLSSKWSSGHFVKDIDQSVFIHMRNNERRPDGSRTGKKLTKLENYQILKERGIL